MKRRNSPTRSSIRSSFNSSFVFSGDPLDRLPSLAAGRCDKNDLKFDFVTSMPIVRRGLLDVFGLDSAESIALINNVEVRPKRHDAPSSLAVAETHSLNTSKNRKNSVEHKAQIVTSNSPAESLDNLTKKSSEKQANQHIHHDRMLKPHEAVKHHKSSPSHSTDISRKSSLESFVSHHSTEESLDELHGVFDHYFGVRSRVDFVKKVKTSYSAICKYSSESDLPEVLSSPRSLYLREISKAQLLPLPLVLRKESNPKGVFLGHKGLGDKRMLPVIEIVEKLPAVETIDISDNRLTDVSLMPLAAKLQSMKNLTSLDLSFNKIDESSETLMDFLREPDCSLRVLLLNGADVDDGESVFIFKAIAANKSLHTVGLANNMIGNTELEMTLHPDMETGGKAIFDMLRDNQTLTKLDLSWNSIRFQSAATIGEGLIHNSSIKSLNLAHNSFGDMGTQQLGKALKRNNTLQEIDLSCNSLSPKSVTVLGNGLFYNESMLYLNVDGNVLGFVGTQALVAAIQRSAFGVEPRRLKVSFNNCDCKKIIDGLFNASNPGGKWKVDLSEPYGQMVVEECFFLANFRAGCNISKCFYNGKQIFLERKVPESALCRFNLDSFYKNSRNAAQETLKKNYPGASDWLDQLLMQFDFHMVAKQRILVVEKVYDHWMMRPSKTDKNDLSEEYLFEVFFALFIINDTDKSNTMEVHEFLRTLESLGRTDVDRDRAKVLMAEHDKDDSGTIDANEFAMIMVNEFCRTDLPKGILVEKGMGKPWEIPSNGTVEIDMIYEFDSPTMFDVGHDEGIENVIEAMRFAKTLEQKEIIFEQATSSPYYFMSADQGQMLFDEAQCLSMASIDVIAAILPQLVNEDQVVRFIDNNLNDYGKMTLRVRLGQLYNTYIGMSTGHYFYDLKTKDAKNGGKRLSALSTAESKFCRQLGADTSQKGNRSNFRNEMLGGNTIVIDGSWFARCPSSGLLRFDYVSTSRPRQGTRPLSDQRFHRVLHKLGVYDVPSKVAELIRENSDDSNMMPTMIGQAEVLHFDDTAPRLSKVPALGVQRSIMGISSAKISGRSSTPSTPVPSTKPTTSAELLAYVQPPLTVVHVKEQFFEYMDSCHHYLDIYPKEKMRDVSRSNYNPDKNPETPENMKIGPDPPRDSMPIFYPYIYRILLELQIMLPGMYFSVSQVIELAKYFPKDAYFRIQIICSLFSRIVDLENFDEIFDRFLDADERREILHRVGILNIIDPMKADRLYTLDLRRWDHREVCKMLVALAVAEPGENWVDEEYRWSKYDDVVPGWELPASWALEDSENNGDGGPRKHGWIILTYRSEGFGCAPVWPVRKQLRRKTLVGMKRIL